MTPVYWTRRVPLGVVALALFSCTDAATPPTESQRSLLGGLSLTLLACAPLDADSVTQTVGPGGGTLAIGPHTLLVPAGALDSSVAITAVAPSDTVNMVWLEPEGLAFATPARLTMSYANCQTVSLPKRIVYLDDDLVILELLRSLDEPLEQRVTASLDHFSNYAVAW